MKIAQLIDESLHGWGNFPVIEEFTPGENIRSVTSEETLNLVGNRTQFFRDCGIGKGVLIPIFLDNSIEFIITLLALLKIEAVPLMVKMEFRRLELEEIFRNAEPQFVITEKSHYPVIQAFTKGRNVLLWDGNEYQLPTEFFDIQPRTDLPDDIATINYTYRGYGFPLGAITTNKQYLTSVYQLQGMIHFQKGETLLVILPMSHIFPLVGCIFLPLIFRNTALIAKTLNPRHLTDVIDRKAVENIISIPEIYELFYRTVGENGLPSSLERLVSGGSILTAEKHREYEKAFGVQVIHGYGLTEFAPVSGNIYGSTRGTMGPVGPLIDFRIVNQELQIKGPGVTLGYYRRNKETSEAFDGSWFLTGDYCREQNGHLVFAGEKKGTRKVNGNLVDLAEVSKALYTYPRTKKADISFEDGVLYANVEFPSDTNASNELKNLRHHLKEIVAVYKIPRIKLMDNSL